MAAEPRDEERTERHSSSRHGAVGDRPLASRELQKPRACVVAPAVAQNRQLGSGGWISQFPPPSEAVTYESRT